VLKKLTAVLLKIALSLAAVFAFITLSINMPFFSEDQESGAIGLSSLTDAGNQAAGLALPHIGFADGSDRFDGNFFASGENSGFTLTDIDMQGPCENAGRRHLEQSCTQCVVMDGVSEPGQPATLFWSDPNGSGEMGTIFRDCTMNVDDTLVRVPKLAFTAEIQNLDLRERPAGSAPIPKLARSERTSNMTLGEWTITVDTVHDNHSALDSMGRLLQDAGWQEAAQGSQTPAAENQKVYVRDESALCVVTLNKANAGFQLVTMMNL